MEAPGAKIGSELEKLERVTGTWSTNKQTKRFSLYYQYQNGRADNQDGSNLSGGRPLDGMSPGELSNHLLFALHILKDRRAGQCRCVSVRKELLKRRLGED